MTLTKLIAKHLREVHFGVNWTWSNVRDQLKDVTWQQATTKVYDLNTIVALVYHMNYYVVAHLKVMHGGPLDAKDIYSFDHPPINSEEDWDNMRNKILDDAETLATMIEQLPETKLWETFVEEKYGTNYRNFQGIIEHTHYHLGQIAIVKKILMQEAK
ncbi:MAG TPA: DinB family protein [Saprospiraceae bacterium]|nr:DinB family protein [Saprospiraceae bacterium]